MRGMCKKPKTQKKKKKKKKKKKTKAAKISVWVGDGDIGAAWSLYSLCGVPVQTVF
jgi:hypothetical protein